MEIVEEWKTRVDDSTDKTRSLLYNVYSYVTGFFLVLMILFTLYLVYTFARRLFSIVRTRRGRSNGKVKKLI